ncbi:MAG: hypothetical protein LBD03_02010 [Methanobrevibacter sp.]|jgi:hypothetical protein|nr:hypothetical protein [Candidatus Methanovirga procula]
MAKKENKTKNDFINEYLEKMVEEQEFIEEKNKYPDGIPIEVVAMEFGETPEEFMRNLKRADESEGIALDADKLEERYSL